MQLNSVSYLLLENIGGIMTADSEKSDSDMLGKILL